jgi:hypothetical protein
MASVAAICALFFLLPQAPDSGERGGALIVSGVLREGSMPLRALGLGEGGIGEPVAPPGHAGDAVAGQDVTPGGVLVRAQREGVKLDFPSGAELLLAPDGGVHLREGARTMPSLHVVELWLADGTRVRAVRSPGRGMPLREVDVIRGDAAVSLWRGHLPLRQTTAPSPPSGTCYLALGRGDALYEGVALGPLIVLRRALCPQARQRESPASWLVVAGDVLGASLRLLPDHVPPQPVQFPQAPEAAANLAQGAPMLFPSGVIERPAGAIGALVFALAGDFRLMVEERRDGPIWLGLYRGDADVPVVEWCIEHRTTLHLVRPNGGLGGLPRYYLRGIDLSGQTRSLLPLPRTAFTIERARATLRALGARSPLVRAVPASTRDG